MPNLYEPFELAHSADGQSVLRLHGTKEAMASVGEADVKILLDAIQHGWDLDLRFVQVRAAVDLAKIISDLPEDPDGRRRVAGDVYARNVEFHGPVQLFGAAFAKRGFFLSCTFHRNVSFSGGVFRGDADFTETVFRGDTNYEGVRFEGDVTFMGAKFGGEGRFAAACFERPATFADVQFRENTVFAGLWNHILQPLLRPIGRLVGVKINKRTTTTFLGLHTEMMDGTTNRYLVRYIQDEQWIRSWRRRGHVRRILFVLWELTSHCGRSLALWAFWAGLVALTFGAIYADYNVPAWMPEPVASLLVRMDPEFDVSPEERKPTGFTPYYFSIVTFTTLGFGDVTPTSKAGEIWLVVEVLLGYVMLGGLIAIFANKFARRS